MAEQLSFKYVVEECESEDPKEAGSDEEEADLDEGKTGGVVRITNRKTAERHLLKDFVGSVIDLAFAHCDDVILAVVDEIENMCIYDVQQTDDRKISSSMLLYVRRPETALVSEYHRVIWCPYIPDDADDSSATDSSMQDNASRMLVLTNDEQAEIWSVDLVTREYGNGPLLEDNVEIGLIRIKSHTKPITDAAFSPDGTALATASLDGEVMFFQVHMNENTSPRCLHQWKPHSGKPMSCLFFLDDHKNCSPDALFWKFAVTGANNNQELKIWSCDSWRCLQTIRFLCPPGVPSNFTHEPRLKAALDLSGRFVVLSDIHRNVILEIYEQFHEKTCCD